MDRQPVYYTVKEVAQILKLAPGTIYRAIYRGDLKYIKIGRAIRIPEESLRELSNKIA